MSNLERRQRIDELKERLFLEIKNKGAGGGGAGYGAPEIPSYNAPAPAPAPSYNNDPLPSYGAPSIPSYGAFDGFNFNKGPGKVIEIPVPDLPIPDPIEFKAAVLRSKGRIASGLLHTKAGLLRAGANILAQKANALDKFAQAIPAIKANVINSLQGLGGGKGGGGYGAPPANNYGAPAPQVQPPPSYNAPAPQEQPPPSYNSGGRPATTNINIQPVSQNNFRPSNSDSYGSPVGGVITNPRSPVTVNNDDVANVPVGSSLSFGSSVTNTGLDSGLTSSLTSSNGFSPITTSTFDQGSLPKRNVFGTVSGQVQPGQTTTITLNNLRQTPEQLLLRETRQQQGICRSDFILNDLLQDIFMGNELIPDIIDRPPRYPLEVSYKTIRTFPGMRLTADMTRFKPMLKWPAQPDSLYTVVMSNLDINSRRNRTLSEFWHWFVANIPGDSVDDGEVIFELLFPLVLPEGDGDHRYGFFVFEQPGQLNYQDEGGPTDSCSPQMSNGRGPFKSTKNFMKKYNLDLTAATFIILDSNEASMEIACEWQKCIGNTINLVSPLQCG